MRRQTSSTIKTQIKTSNRPHAPLLDKEGVGGGWSRRMPAQKRIDLPPSPLGKGGSNCRNSIRRCLLNWYDKNKRDLPWRRRERDAYAQWVAEIMLQQTRVETVLRYYEPFLSRFPTFQALAKARHQDVLKMWEGLGYYRRILHLHRAVQGLCDAGKSIPTTAQDLQELPGVGLYTASAIASIAFGEAAAAVDANVARVISRLVGMKEMSSAAARTQIQNEANRLICKCRPGDFNQAWMDLGSSICLPRDPQCGVCPLNRYCAVGKSRIRQLPVPRPKGTPTVCSIIVGMISNKGRLLLTRRPEGGLWSGLWEFPSLELKKKNDPDVLDRFAAAHSLAVPQATQKIGVVRHQLSHRSISFHVFAAEMPHASPRTGKSVRWVSQDAFERLPVSTAHRRIHRLWTDFRARLGANCTHH